MDETTLSRRGMFAVGAVGLAAIAGLSGGAEASDYGTLGEVEKKNMKVVEDWLKAFADPAVDEKANQARYDKIVGMMTPDVIWVFPQRGRVVGQAAVYDALKSFHQRSKTYDLKIIDSWARGPLVINTRIDTVSVDGGPPQPAPGPLGGVFVLKDGKIAENYEMAFSAHDEKK